MFKNFWAFLARQMGTAARAALVVCAVVIVVATTAFGYWVSRTDYQVLFADLAPQDTAAMTAELDRLKIPYVLSDQGDAHGSNVGTILVDRSDVYKTRIKLMGKDIPLHGAVGFELFNNSDLGMTEFAQKISYQRALQGELTRTILSLSEIRDARVLLALPEQGLFKQSNNRSKASVSLSLKAGEVLRPVQVVGIQRLVAAAVPGILVQDVTIVDQSGVALTRPSAESGEADAGAGGSRLDLKKDTEAYLARKAAAVLDHALGQGQALASVDVALNMDRVQSSTDELVGAPGKAGAAPTGLITRERDTARDMGPPLGGVSSAGSAGAGGGSNQHEVEYALGHRVEQVISQPGSIRRIQVAVVVKRGLTPELQEQLRKMVAASVGASIERGDTVVLQPMEALGLQSPAATGVAAMGGGPSAQESGVSVPATQGGTATGFLSQALSNPLLLVLGVVVVCGLLWVLMQLGKRSYRHGEKALTEGQRRDALEKVRVWMQEAEAAPNARGVPAPVPARTGARPAGASR